MSISDALRKLTWIAPPSAALSARNRVDTLPPAGAHMVAIGLIGKPDGVVKLRVVVVFAMQRLKLLTSRQLCDL